MIDPIELRFTVDCSPEQAFDVWASRTALWWPVAHTVSAESGVRVTFEPRAGGRIFERTRGGAEHEWGEVVAWDPPRELRYLWFIRRDRGDATDVTISFDGTTQETTVTIVHEGWERLGRRGPAWREMNRAGWAGVLPDYRRACAELDPSQASQEHSRRRNHAGQG